MRNATAAVLLIFGGLCLFSVALQISDGVTLPNFFPNVLLGLPSVVGGAGLLIAPGRFAYVASAVGCGLFFLAALRATLVDFSTGYYAPGSLFGALLFAALLIYLLRDYRHLRPAERFREETREGFSEKGE